MRLVAMWLGDADGWKRALRKDVALSRDMGPADSQPSRKRPIS